MVNGFGTLNPSSGIATAFEGLALALAAGGHNVTVAYMGRGPSEPALASAAAAYARQGVALVRYARPLAAASPSLHGDDFSPPP